MDLFFRHHHLSGRVVAAALIGWLATAAIAIGAFTASEVARMHGVFIRQSATIYEIIRQRLDQNEAVMTGVDSLLHTFPGVTSAALRSYSHQMLVRYPHIYMIELQSRVERPALHAFETWAKREISPEYIVKDYDYGGMRQWSPAAERPVYYPITFMEPQTQASHPVLGLDVYADGKFQGAIDKAIRTGKASISAPFSLFEGGQAYLIFKAVYARTPEDEASKPGLATRLMSMLIHTGKFLAPSEMPSSMVSMHIYEQGFGYDDPDGMIGRIDAEPVAAWITRFMPEFAYRKILPSQIQPFVLETRWQSSLCAIPVLPIGVTLIATAFITLIAIAAYQTMIASKRAVRETEQRMLRKEEQEKVARLHTMGEMISGIAHELNQPLAAILSYNQACIRMLHESNPDIEAIQGAMKSLSGQANRAADIIVRLRAFISKRPARALPLDMRRVIQNALSLAEPWLKNSSVTTHVDTQANVPRVLADYVQIEQVVLNLVRNAIQAMDSTPPGNRMLTLTLAHDGQAVRLAVRDTGPGVSEDMRKTLFHPFRTSKEDGMGLGLIICQSIAETYGGTVVENPSTPSGAEFQLILPIQHAEIP